MFITFEGPEGSGKTSVLREVQKRITEITAREVVFTREPGGIDIAEKIRDIILDTTHTAMHARTEALLYAAARAQHFHEKIYPAIHAHKHVICDRFIDSSLAYQGHARGLGIEAVEEINRFAIGPYPVDATIFFDVHPRVGLERIEAAQTRENNRLDQEDLMFHANVYAGYHEVWQRNPQRFYDVDASKPFEEVVEDVLALLQKILTAGSKYEDLQIKNTPPAT